MTTGIFYEYEKDRLDAIASRFLAAILAVVEFGSGADDGGPLYAAALTKALIEAQAAIAADLALTEEQQAALLDGIMFELRTAVADRRSEG